MNWIIENINLDWRSNALIRILLFSVMVVGAVTFLTTLSSVYSDRHNITLIRSEYYDKDQYYMTTLVVNCQKEGYNTTNDLHQCVEDSQNNRVNSLQRSIFWDYITAGVIVIVILAMLFGYSVILMRQKAYISSLHQDENELS